MRRECWYSARNLSDSISSSDAIEQLSFYSSTKYARLIYDTGRFDSNRTIEMLYDGPTFISDSRYPYLFQYWSSTSHFRTPLLDSLHDLTAKCIIGSQQSIWMNWERNSICLKTFRQRPSSSVVWVIVYFPSMASMLIRHVVLILHGRLRCYMFSTLPAMWLKILLPTVRWISAVAQEWTRVHDMWNYRINPLVSIDVNNIDNESVACADIHRRINVDR